MLSQPPTLTFAPAAPTLTTAATGPVSDPVVNYADIKAENVFALSVKTDKSKHPDPTKQITYMSLPLLYNYGTLDQRSVKDWREELPLAYSTGGIFEKEDEKGSSKYSLLLKFNLNRDETKVFLGKNKESYGAIARAVFAQKGQLKCFDMDVERPASTIKDLVQFPRDKVSGEPIPGADPQAYVKVRPWSCAFIGLDGKPIHWRLLQNVNIEGIPLVHKESVYAGGNGKASLQARLVSMVVLKLEPRGNDKLQEKTVKKYAESVGAQGLEVLNAQIAELMLKKQEIIKADDEKLAARKKGKEQKKDAPAPQAGAQPPANGTLQQMEAPRPDLTQFLGNTTTVQPQYQPQAYQAPPVPQTQYQPQAQQQYQPQAQYQPQTQPSMTQPMAQSQYTGQAPPAPQQQFGYNTVPLTIPGFPQAGVGQPTNTQLQRLA